MIFNKMDTLNNLHDEYVSLAFTALKRTIPQNIRRDLNRRGLHEDLEQEISVIALEGMQLYPQKEKDNKFLNFVGRQLYRFLKENGYRRPTGHKSYVRNDIGFQKIKMGGNEYV